MLHSVQPAAAPAPPPIVDLGPVPNPLPKLLTGEDLPSEDAQHLFERLVLGKLEPAEIAGMLIALRMKGETAEEMIGAAHALVGRGAAVRAARLSVRRLLRHRRRRVGADQRLDRRRLRRRGVRPADRQAWQSQRQLELRLGRRARALGAKIDVEPATARRMLDETGFCFLFAPAYHPGMKHAALVRRQLSVRTVMNLLGPCINPARPPVQLLGVADPKMLRRIAQTLAAIGVREALVVHGSGLDEVALHGETRAIRLSDGDDDRDRTDARGRRARARAAERRHRRRRERKCGAAAAVARGRRASARRK